jgi:uracil phosphoribosyltransferase
MKFSIKNSILGVLCSFSLIWVTSLSAEEADVLTERNLAEILKKIESHRNDDQELAKLLPIVKCSFQPSKYERILLSQLRDSQCSTMQFRLTSEKIGDLLVNKVVTCLPSRIVSIDTPVTTCQGEVFAGEVELVSIMRSGDALLDTFIKHFPEANISKFLIQRHEETAVPQFKYMKISPEIASGNPVVITEPMIATGGTLDMVINLLKEKGVKEERIIIAAVCVAPEGLISLSQKFPKIHVVMNALDEKLNEKKFIVPGLGDFGDRYFGTAELESTMNLSQ